VDLPLKLIEVLLVLGGLVAFVWWQMRELRIDGEKTAAETRAREAAEAVQSAPGAQATQDARPPRQHAAPAVDATPGDAPERRA
jgi:hypothetical protein